MIKQSPGIGRVLTMVVFALSCVGIVLFLWLSFGGPVPLRPESYRFQVGLPEATTLAVESDVRISGVSVGKVKTKELDRGAVRTLVEVEIKPRFAPLPRDTRAILRQKTLLGETYLELSPGNREKGDLPDDARLPDAQVEPTVELDEIFSAFDRPTQRAFARATRELARALAGGRARDLNDALGNLEGATTQGERLLSVLDRQRSTLRSLIGDGSVVLGALSDRRGALGGLIRNANQAFEATAARDEALAETIGVLPTFLDESRATLTRVAAFTDNAAPVVSGLQPVADDLTPTVRDLAALAPDLEATFRSLVPLIESAREGLPALARTVTAARPVVHALEPFLDELGPILSLLNFNQTRVAGFITNGTVGIDADFGGQRYNNVVPLVDPRSFMTFTERPEFDRGNAYLQPNFANRIIALGAYESTDCRTAIGRRNSYGDVKPNDAVDSPPLLKVERRRPACLVAGPSLYDGRVVSIPRRGRIPRREPPRGPAGSLPVERRP